MTRTFVTRKPHELRGFAVKGSPRTHGTASECAGIFSGGPRSRARDPAGVGDVLVQLADEVVCGWKFDVGVKVADEAKLYPPLVEIAFEIEEKRFDAQLRAAERRAVADRKRRDEIPIRRARSTGVCAEGRYQLVRLDSDVGCGKAEPPADPLPPPRRPRPRMFAAEQPVRMLDLHGRHGGAPL